MNLLISLLGLSLVSGLAEDKDLLEKEYQASQYISHTYSPSDEEREKAQEVFMLSVNRQFDKALSRYQELLKEYPESPELRADYIFFLDRRGQTLNARNFAQEAVKDFPKSLRLKIIAKHYEEIAKTRSREKRSELKKRMDARLAAWTQIQVEASN